jgi:hypothetical protein
VKFEVSRVKVALKILLGAFDFDKRVFVRLNGNKAVVGVGPEEPDHVVDHLRLDLVAAAVVRDALRR